MDLCFFWFIWFVWFVGQLSLVFLSYSLIFARTHRFSLGFLVVGAFLLFSLAFLRFLLEIVCFPQVLFGFGCISLVFLRSSLVVVRHHRFSLGLKQFRGKAGRARGEPAQPFSAFP